MRLIDAHFAVYAAESEFDEEDASKIRWLISHIPTVDAEPVRHGEWVQASDDDQDEWMYVCSECREETFFPFDEKDNYCPNCGAKMDGGKQDG